MSTMVAGEWVEVLPPEAIAATLDARGAVDELPFMPEMLAFCGRRYRIEMRAERTCARGLSKGERPIRRLDHAVVLEGVRCNGSEHGGCQLGCAPFWKERWLRPVGAPGPADTRSTPPPVIDRAKTLQLVPRQPGDPERFLCQGTQLARATRPVPPPWEPTQYFRMWHVGTLTGPQLLRMYAGIAIAWVMRHFERRGGGVGHPLAGSDVLGLRPGEWVEVKSKAAILATLDANRKLRGLSFMDHYDRYCEKRFRVRERVERVIVEETGQLRKVKDTVILEGADCPRHHGCARGMPPLWREAWLRRVAGER